MKAPPRITLALIRARRGPGQPDGEVVPEPPQLVVPAAVHLTEFEPCEVRMLLAHQGTHQILVDREAVHALTQPPVDQRGW